MSEKGSKPTIAYLGSLPPPIGGISIDLQRLTDRLEQAGYGYTVYDFLNRRQTGSGGVTARINNRWWCLLKFFFSAREDLVCCHHLDWRLRTIVGLMSLLGKKTLVSIAGQSLSDALEAGGWLRRKIIALAMRRYSFVIAHNPVIRQQCLSLGVKVERIKVIYGFIPPLVKEAEIAEIPPEVWNFIESHQPVIAVNAFKLVFYQGQDLYGLDLCVDLCTNLKDSHPEIGLVFCLPNVGDYDYLHKMERNIKEKGIEENFLMITESYQFYPVLMKSQVFLRPTNTDGDATSLREALFFEVPSIASDVFPRPEGTVLFKSRDIDDLTMKVKDVLDNYDSYHKKLAAMKPEDNFTKLLQVYKELIDANKSR